MTLLSEQNAKEIINESNLINRSRKSNKISAIDINDNS